MRNADKTRCPKDHPYDEANTHIGKQSEAAGGGARRQCKQCQRELDARCRNARKKRKRLAAASLVLMMSCSMFQPVYDAAKASTKPLTVGGLTWMAASLVNPLVAAFTAGAVVTVWDVGEAEDEVEELKESNAEILQRLLDEAAPKLKGEILKEGMAAQAKALEAERSTFQVIVDDIWFWLKVGGFGWLAFYALRHYKDVVNFLRFIKLLPAKNV